MVTFLLSLTDAGRFVHVNKLQGKQEVTFPDNNSFYLILVTAAPLFEVAGFVTMVTRSAGVSLWFVINHR